MSLVEKENKRRHGALFVVLVVGAVTAVAAFACLGSFERTRSVASAPAASVKVGEFSDSDRQGVTATFALGATPVIHIQRPGTVTDVAIHPGTVVEQGDVLARIDDVPIRALVGDAPLYRPIGPGAKGADVAALSEFLAATGDLHSQQQPEVYGQALGRAIASFVVRDMGGQPTGVFDPTWVSFVPASSTTVSALTAQLGGRISAEEPFASLVAAPTAVHFASASDGKQLQVPEGGPLLLTIGGTEMTLSSGSLSASELGTAYEAYLAQSREGAITKDGDGASTDSAVFEGATLEIARPAALGVVPNTALYTAANGVSCVFRPANGGSFRFVRVKASPAANMIGVVLIDHRLVGTAVARDWRSVPKEAQASCR
ncbi:biotin/lipoyl-binding protein [Curtobacterium sp. SGAir0471]|uniref:biotin/lipoyl-binding protein n=1 Tax=Curtobacterium sp. SGAir0471 TaxID=2070337 RepID=UPI0010F8D45F|nr:biotin/lipoyl-binding protein [Curtobacterium sp. SGAir0471]